MRVRRSVASSSRTGRHELGTLLSANQTISSSAVSACAMPRATAPSAPPCHASTATQPHNRTTRPALATDCWRGVPPKGWGAPRGSLRPEGRRGAGGGRHCVCEARGPSRAWLLSARPQSTVWVLMAMEADAVAHAPRTEQPRALQPLWPHAAMQPSSGGRQSQEGASGASPPPLLSSSSQPLAC